MSDNGTRKNRITLLQILEIMKLFNITIQQYLDNENYWIKKYDELKHGK